MAIESTLKARGKTHGKFRDNGMVMQAMKVAMRTYGVKWNDMPPYQREAAEMILHKLGRAVTGNHNEPEHWHDIAGYATLVEKILGGEDR